MNATAAEEWTRSRLAVKRLKVHATRPWGATFKVSHAEGRAWLKTVPPCLASSVAATACLAKLCPEQVPSVLAFDTSQGYLITCDHGLRDLSRSASESQRFQLLITIAGIESSCRQHPKLLSLLPHQDPTAALDDLMWFLGDDRTPQLSGATVTAAHFLSRERCARYRQLLEKRLPLLQRFLLESTGLVPTISHGDLRPSNAAQDEHSAIILYDWEEAFVAPAGASLHAMFGGCADLLALLDENLLGQDPETLRESRIALAGYVDVLVDGGYASREALEGRALAASAVMGMLRFLVSYSRFPGAEEDSRYRSVVRRNLKRRFTDLLDVCDHLSVSASPTVRADAELYRQTGREERAERLLISRLRRRPDDAEAKIALGHLLLAQSHGKSGARRALVEAATEQFESVLERAGDSNEAREGLADCLAYLARPGDAAIQLHRALSKVDGNTTICDATDADASDDPGTKERETLVLRLHHLQRLQRHQEDADSPGQMPTLTFSVEEKECGIPEPATLAVADALFRQHGVLLLREVFDSALLQRCRETFLQRYRRYLSNERQDDALRIGDKRFQITIDIADPYNSSDLYANSLVLPLMQRLLGRDVVLSCFTSAMSLPGAEQQRLHKDHKALFYDDPESTTLPSFAITTMVPLVPVDERCGTTRVRKGSHRLTTKESLGLPDQTPITRMGDCYLMDYRLSHFGQANSSSQPRPILSLVYNRPWFRDYINFNGQPSLRLSTEALAEVPKEHRSLLEWTAEPGPRT